MGSVSPLPCAGPRGPPPQPTRPHLSGPWGQLTFMVGSFSTRGRQYTGTGTFFIRVSSWPPLGLSCNHKAEATWARVLGQRAGPGSKSRALRRWGRGGTAGLPRRLPSCRPACPSNPPASHAPRPLQHLLVLGRQAPAAGLQPPIVVAHVLAHLAVLLALLLPAGGGRAVTGQEAHRLLPAQARGPALHGACLGPAPRRQDRGSPRTGAPTPAPVRLPPSVPYGAASPPRGLSSGSRHTIPHFCPGAKILVSKLRKTQNSEQRVIPWKQPHTASFLWAPGISVEHRGGGHSPGCGLAWPGCRPQCRLQGRGARSAEGLCAALWDAGQGLGGSAQGHPMHPVRLEGGRVRPREVGLGCWPASFPPRTMSPRW